MRGQGAAATRHVIGSGKWFAEGVWNSFLREGIRACIYVNSVLARKAPHRTLLLQGFFGHFRKAEKGSFVLDSKSFVFARGPWGDLQ